MSDPEIRLERTSKAPVDRLWETLVRPALWWGEDVLLEPRPGGLFHEPWRDVEGQHHTRGKVLEIEPPRLLRLSWRDDDWDFGTQVRFSLSGKGEGSRILMCHSGWQAAPEPRQAGLLDDHRGGWNHHLGNLVACAEQRSSTLKDEVGA
ncbi:SRPBCC family protein [Roseibium sp. Sym1]|uniref:SRPBCC family protein n=1 Tax=Roseibium sp. Sym1 TaxID=3016006 RepID=UPI0022B51278|nr:SRPBCC domain-containing protein [Roseibium sp. Sym1]